MVIPEPNICPKCKSRVERPVVLRTRCWGPSQCLQNESGRHIHIDSICPFCGNVLQTFVQSGWNVSTFWIEK